MNDVYKVTIMTLAPLLGICIAFQFFMLPRILTNYQIDWVRDALLYGEF